MSVLDEYDDEGRWRGPCPDCGGDHDGIGPADTLGGGLACLRARIRELDDPAAAALGAELDQVEAHVAALREDGLRRFLSS